MEGMGAALRLRCLRHLTVSVGVEAGAAVARGFVFLNLDAVLSSLSGLLAKWDLFSTEA